MTAPACVMLIGNSVLLAGIKAELESRKEYELVTVAVGGPEAAALVRLRRPRAVIFDLAAPDPYFALTLLRDQPGLRVIGVDPSSDQLLVLSGRTAEGETAMHLEQAILAAASSYLAV